MFDKQIDDFIELTTDLIPGVFEKATLGKCEVHDYYAVMDFSIGEHITTEDLLDMLEDNMELTIMYVHRRTESTNAGITVCAYSDHTFDDRFCIHAVTGADGLVHSITATLFFSIEVMMEHLVDDLEQHSKFGRFESVMTREDVMTAFC